MFGGRGVGGAMWLHLAILWMFVNRSIGLACGHARCLVGSRRLFGGLVPASIDGVVCILLVLASYLRFKY